MMALWQRHTPLLVALAESEDDAPGPLRDDNIGNSEVDQVRTAASGVQKHREDRSGTHIRTQFQFTQ